MPSVHRSGNRQEIARRAGLAKAHTAPEDNTLWIRMRIADSLARRIGEFLDHSHQWFPGLFNWLRTVASEAISPETARVSDTPLSTALMAEAVSRTERALMSSSGRTASIRRMVSSESE